MVTDNTQALRKIPAVDRVLQSPLMMEALVSHPRSLVLKAVHDTLEEIRRALLAGEPAVEESLMPGQVAQAAFERLARLSRPSLRPVINATGVVVHTNLGRSILAERVIRRFREIAGGYSNLEYDLHEGHRGSRYVHVEEILRELTGAEGAMVVNNNAAAVLISLETLARGREVVVSRGQLVEIGGSFRIPEVMKKSGAKMVEVGTTNKTHLRDYEEVINPETALLLKVHTSNYQVVGFTSEVPLAELVALGKRHGIPVMEDLGSGCLVDFGPSAREPTVQEALKAGADLVTFSGDKLLGGPQAGIILGRADLVDAVRKNQLSRAMRIDKLTLMALEETLRLYRDPETALREVPTLRMISQPYPDLAKKAEKLVGMVKKGEAGRLRIALQNGASRAGGGALPLLELPTRLLALSHTALSAQEVEQWLRGYDPPIIVRLEKEQALLDPRTVQDEEMPIVAQALRILGGITSLSQGTPHQVGRPC